MQEFVDFPLRLLAGVAVALLKHAFQLDSLAVDQVEIAVGEFSHVCWTLPRISFHFPSNVSMFMVGSLVSLTTVLAAVWATGLEKLDSRAE